MSAANPAKSLLMSLSKRAKHYSKGSALSWMATLLIAQLSAAASAEPEPQFKMVNGVQQPLHKPTGWVPPTASPISFDPSKCSQDPHGMIYIAIGKTVLRHPKDDVLARDDPPQAVEPRGCPGNPLKGGYLRFSGLPDFVDPKPGFVVYLVSAEDAAEELSHHEGLFDSVCSNPLNLVDNSVPGFKGCKSPKKSGFPIPKDPSYAIYQAEHYLTPVGQKFILDCNELAQFWGRSGCEINRQLNDDILINYNFYRDAFPIARIIALDRELQRRIAAEEVNGYPGVTPTTGKHEEKRHD